MRRLRSWWHKWLCELGFHDTPRTGSDKLGLPTVPVVVLDH